MIPSSFISHVVFNYKPHTDCIAVKKMFLLYFPSNNWKKGHDHCAIFLIFFKALHHPVSIISAFYVYCLKKKLFVLDIFICSLMKRNGYINV